ncbi:MAG TPA: alpha/beta fold hydrolase [Acidimicrobiia bacterium]|nr:alpha/beta fold hydrolase [Acidimicrobiia bacterium]
MDAPIGALPTWSFEEAAEDVRMFCDVLGIVDPIVLGHSFGGPVAIAYAARNPDHPGGLILQSTMAFFDLDRVVEDFRQLAGDEIADSSDAHIWAMTPLPPRSGIGAGDCSAAGCRARSRRHGFLAIRNSTRQAAS